MVGYCDECRRVFVYSANEDAMCYACQNELSDMPEEEMDNWLSIGVLGHTPDEEEPAGMR